MEPITKSFVDKWDENDTQWFIVTVSINYLYIKMIIWL